MLVCVFFAQFAHETAGAARTRYSLLPLFEGDGRRISSGRTAPASVDACPAMIEVRMLLSSLKRDEMKLIWSGMGNSPLPSGEA
jgi:hypothetical protein